MHTLTQRILALSVVLMTVSAFCIAIAYLIERSGHSAAFGGVQSAIGGSLTAIPAAVLALVFLSRYGSGVKVLLVATLLRFGLTMGLTLYVAWAFPTLRSLTFFLTVTVVYLVGLFVETWLAWKEYQQVGESLPCIRHKP